MIRQNSVTKLPSLIHEVSYKEEHFTGKQIKILMAYNHNSVCAAI